MMAENIKGKTQLFLSRISIMMFHRWHADVKPDNILLIDGKFKLADPGFVKFVQGGSEEHATVVDGCTWTYSKSPPRQEDAT